MMSTFEAAEKIANAKKGEKYVAAGKKPNETKRERRKKQQKQSDKNEWLIQHSKIQSMDRRENIYVRDAGLNETNAEKMLAVIDPKIDLMSPEVKFGRILAGTDQRKRHAAVKKLQAYLKARCDIAEVGLNGGISEIDLLKLWKALWYTLYMADKKPVQDELSKHLCKLLWCVVGTEEEDECAGQAYLDMIEEEFEMDNDGEDYGVELEEIMNTLKESKGDYKDDSDDNKTNGEKDNDEMVNDVDITDIINVVKESEFDNVEIPHCRGAHLASLFLRTFFRTIRRDWHLMDKYRVDKFYTLIRSMMHEVYEYMSVRNWNYGITVLLNDAIFDEILKQPPNGLRYHLIDLCLEELAKVNSKSRTELTEQSFIEVLEPFFGLCQTGSRNFDDTVQSRAMERVLENFLDNYSVISDRALEDDDNNGNASATDNANNSRKEDMDDLRGGIFNYVHVGSISEFVFALGSDPETSSKYRKSLYDMHKKFSRRLKLIEKDVKLETDEYHREEEGEIEFDQHDSEMIVNYNENGPEKSKEPKIDDNDSKTDSSSKKLKEKSKKRKSVEMDTDSAIIAEKNEQGSLEAGSKQSKKKSKNDVKNLTEQKYDDEEELVITLSEQKYAKMKKKRLKKKKHGQDSAHKVEFSDSKEDDEFKNERKNNCSVNHRRVSFGKKNRSKSHKASMRALRTANPPTKEATPTKGILRKQPRHSGKVATVLIKSSRKKTASYF